MSPSAQHHRKDDPPDFEPARAETDATGLLPTDSRAERVLKLAIKLGFGTVLTAVILYWLAMSYLPSNEARADRLIEATRADLRDARQENVQLADRYLEAREQDRAVTSKLADSLRELATESNVSACVHFDGSNDRFRIPTYTGATLTISMWANHDTFALGRLICSEDYATSTRGFIFFTSGQKIAIERGNGGSQVIAQDSATLSAGTWYHFAATICPTGLIIYKDGVGVATNLTISTNVPGTYTAVGILDDAPFYGPFDGLIDEIKIWSNEYRTAAQVLSEFNLKKANYGK